MGVDEPEVKAGAHLGKTRVPRSGREGGRRGALRGLYVAAGAPYDDAREAAFSFFAFRDFQQCQIYFSIAIVFFQVHYF